MNNNKSIIPLSDALEGKEYIVSGLETFDDELDSFLFTLGCYSGEPVVVVSKLSGGYVVSIKDGRYNMDKNLASSILVTEK